MEGRPKAPGTGREKNAWISEATWRLMDERVSALQYPAKAQALIRRLIRVIAAIMRGDRKLRAEEAGAEVEALLVSDPLNPLGIMAQYKG